MKPANKILRHTDLYCLYQYEGKQTYHAKVFKYQTLKRYNLLKTLIYNQEVFTESKNFSYPWLFHHIEQRKETKDGFVFLTKPYEIRLNEFLDLKKNLTEDEALEIFSHIFNAVKSLYKAGFCHCNLRPENFVKVKDTWKLQSIVCAFQTSNSISSEYLPRKDHLPPQILNKQPLTEYALYNRIVWDLGSILLHLFLGKHYLKSEKILERFKGQPFKLKVLGLRQQLDLSQKMQTLIARLCHYDYKERISMGHLFTLSFIQDYQKLQVSQENNIIMDNQEEEEQEEEEAAYPNYFNIYSLQLSEGTNFNQSRPKRISKIQENKSKFEEIMEHENHRQNEIDPRKNNDKSSIPNYHNSQIYIEIEEPPALNPIINQLYKSQVQKCELLIMDDWKFQEIINFYRKPRKGRQIALLSKYLLLFVSGLLLHDLGEPSIFQKKFKPILERHAIKWKHFIEYTQTMEYSLLQEKICMLKSYISKTLIKQRKKIEDLDEKTFVLKTQSTLNFIFDNQTSSTKYDEMKQLFRGTIFNEIIKPFSEAFYENTYILKKNDFAEIVMHATYWLCFDKIYRKREMQENFKPYFLWLKEDPSFYVSSDKYQEYLNEAEPEQLMEESNSIRNKYFDFEL